MIIIKATKAMGTLKNIWNTREVTLTSKIKLYEVIEINVLLWNGENWSGNKNNAAMIEAFYHNSMLIILNMIMS